MKHFMILNRDELIAGAFDTKPIAAISEPVVTQPPLMSLDTDTMRSSNDPPNSDGISRGL